MIDLHSFNKTSSVFYYDYAVFGLVAEKPGLQPPWNASKLIVDAGHCKQSQHKYHHAISQKVHENRLKVEIYAILHAIGCKSNHYRAYPKETHWKFLQTTPNAGSQPPIHQYRKFAFPLQQARQQKQSKAHKKPQRTQN